MIDASYIRWCYLLDDLKYKYKEISTCENIVDHFHKEKKVLDLYIFDTVSKRNMEKHDFS